MNIGELKIRLGVDADTFKLKDFAHELGKIPFSVVAGITALTGMSFAFKDVMNYTLGLANNLRVFTTMTGISAEAIQGWTGIAKRMGLPIEAAQQSLQNLSTTFAKAKISGWDSTFISGARRLGVNFHTDQNTLLRNALVAAYGKSDRNKAAQELSMMGISPELMQAGGLSDKQYAQMVRDSQILGVGGIKGMANFQNQLGALETDVMKHLASALISSAPLMGKLAEGLTKFIDNIGPHFLKGVSQFAANAGEASEYLVNGKESWNMIGNFLNKFFEYDLPRMVEESKHPVQVTVQNEIKTNGDTVTTAHQATVRSHRHAISQINNGGQ